jgi:hypothetical protein
MKREPVGEATLRRICESVYKLVETDFCEQMCCKNVGIIKGKFTQKEAREMADIIGKTYSLSHQIFCNGCRETAENKRTPKI